VGGDVFELAAADGELSVAAGRATSPDAVVTMGPNVFYALATRRTTPRAVRERVDVEGDASVATGVLDALSGAAPG
jgi:ubiquinone biosynthesis protein UbiJ